MSQNGEEYQDQLHRQSPPLLVQSGGKDDLDVVIAEGGGIGEAAGSLVDNVVSATSASTLLLQFQYSQHSQLLFQSPHHSHHLHQQLQWFLCEFQGDQISVYVMFM